MAFLPIIMASHPVSASMFTASCAEKISPLPITGMEIFSLTALIMDQSARPPNSCLAVRGWTAMASTPQSSAIRAMLTACSPLASQPVRILMVSGIRMALRTALSNVRALSGALISAAPDPVLTTFRTAQPKLISRIPAPILSTIAAASAIMSGSDPNIWAERGSSCGADCSNRTVLPDWYTSPQELTIPEQTKPQPASLAKRRKGKLVIPAKGARMTLLSNVAVPIFMGFGRWL